MVDDLADGTASAQPQTGEVTLAPKLESPTGPSTGRLDAHLWSTRVRGVTPEPGAFTSVDGVRVKVLDATIARDAPHLEPGAFDLVGRARAGRHRDDPIELLKVHPAGKKAMDPATDWWRGRPPARQGRRSERAPWRRRGAVQPAASRST